MTDIKTLEALMKKHLPGMSLTVNQPLIEALNLYIEEKIKEARIDELKLTNNGSIGFEADRASYLPKDHDKTKNWPIVSDGVIIYSRHYYWSRIKELEK